MSTGRRVLADSSLHSRLRFRSVAGLVLGICGLAGILALAGIPPMNLALPLLLYPAVLLYSGFEQIGVTLGAHTPLTDSAHGPPFLNVVGVVLVYFVPAVWMLGPSLWTLVAGARNDDGRSGR